jgi:hypothetical protein
VICCKVREKIEKYEPSLEIEDEALRLVDQPPSIVNDARHERGRDPHAAEQHLSISTEG